jgi:hypothetical protein
LFRREPIEGLAQRAVEHQHAVALAGRWPPQGRAAQLRDGACARTARAALLQGLGATVRAAASWIITRWTLKHGRELMIANLGKRMIDIAMSPTHAHAFSALCFLLSLSRRPDLIMGLFWVCLRGLLDREGITGGV